MSAAGPDPGAARIGIRCCARGKVRSAHHHRYLLEIAGPFAPYFSEERVKNNIWAREYEDVLGIKLNFLWFANESVDDSVQKKNVAIASGDIPDLMIVNNEQLVLLEKTNLLNRDLMPVFEQYASEMTKAWAYKEGPEAMNSATFQPADRHSYIEDS